MSGSDPTIALPVTGEAVTLDQRTARLPSRTLALLIDLCVQVPLLIAALLLAGWAASGLDEAAGAALLLTATVGTLVGYPLLVEVLSHGRSLGKLALGLRVVRDDGGPARFRHSLVRALFLVLELWVSSGAIGLIASLLSAKCKRLGDQFAGTVVVNERVTRAATMPVAPVVPQGLESWAATLDLSRLPDALASQAASVLGRWHQLAPAARESLAAALASEVARAVAPPPPPGVPAAAYLAAVLGERTRRSYAARPPLPPPPGAAAYGPGPAPMPPVAPPAATPPAAAPPAEQGPFRLPF